MQAEWTSFYGDDFPDAVNAQDPVQHWLLVRLPTDTDPRSEQASDLIVAYVFNFKTEATLREFRAQFDPDVDRPNNPQVFFPEGIAPKPIFGDGKFLAVGFSKLGNLEAIYEHMQEQDLGEIYLTGVEVENAHAIEAPKKTAPPTGSDRFIAVIDTDIAFANARFRKDVTKTRFAAFWDQNGDAGALLPLFLGRSLETNDIDGWLSRFNQNGNVDEPALYNQYFTEAYPADAYPRLPSSLGHGTHVLDLVTGGETDGPPILGVNLRNRAVDATHGLLLFPWLILALLWILQFTGTGRTSPKAQINFSFGGIAGRHDGKGPIEMVFDALVENELVSAISLPAGNFYDSQTHASLSGADLAEPRVLEWIVQPDDGSSNILEIWLPPKAASESQVAVTVTPPIGQARGFSDTDLGIWELADGAEVFARVYVQRVSTFGATDRTRISVFGRHTAIDRDYFQYRGGLPDLAGPWRIEIARTGLGEEETVEFWIERDDQLGLARNGAKQSYFRTDRAVYPERKPPDLPVRNENTLSDIATGARSLVMAGAYRNARQVPGYSSEGLADADMRVPTAAAICDDSRMHPGVLATGFFSGSTRAMNGTSVASAIGGHVVNSRLALGEGVDRDEIMDLAKTDNGGAPPNTAEIDPVFGTYAHPPKTRIGWGILNTGWTRLPRFFE